MAGSGSGFERFDIRRALGIRHENPADAVRRVIDFYQTSNTLILTNDRIAGARLVATDADWSHGEGLEASGPLLSLLVVRRVANAPFLGGSGE